MPAGRGDLKVSELDVQLYRRVYAPPAAPSRQALTFFDMFSMVRVVVRCQRPDLFNSVVLTPALCSFDALNL